jgi:hypothetical protein
VLIVLKSGSLKLLEPSGSVQACKGNALPFYSLEYVKSRTLKHSYVLHIKFSEVIKDFITENFFNLINLITSIARIGEGIGVYRILVGKPEGKRPLGRPRRKWEDDIKADLQEVECGYGLD